MSDTASQEKDELLEGPLKLALTSQGVESFLAKNQKVKKYKFFDSSEQFGLEVPGVPGKALQKMAMGGSISKIERVVNNFASQRRAVMDLTRYFGYAFLYRQFETRLWEVFLRSDVVTQWNRQNPRLTMSPETNTASPAFQMLIDKAQDSILAYKQQVLSAIQTKVQSDPKSLPEEKKSRLLQAIRYLNAIDPAIWLIFAVSRDPAASHVLLQDLRMLLAMYVERSDIPEYLALMLVELVVIVGNVGQAAAQPGTPAFDQHESVFVSYELGVMKKSQEEKMRVRIVLGNEQTGFGQLKSRIDLQGGNKARSLDSYFGEGHNQDLGLMYLTYVQEACRKLDIYFDSFVNQVPHSRQTLVNINLTL